MENLNASAVHSRMEWTAPELNKVDVEEITASASNIGGDGALLS